MSNVWSLVFIKSEAGRVQAAACKGQLRELDSIRARALLLWLDLEGAPLAARQRVKVHGRIESGPVEEILPPVLSGYETESTVGDQLLDGACRHLPHSPLESKCRERTALSRIRRPRRTSPLKPGDRSTLPPDFWFSEIKKRAG